VRPLGNQENEAHVEQDNSLSVAIVGISGCFSGAANLAALWRAVVDGDVLLSRLSHDGLVLAEVEEQTIADPAYVPVRGVVADADCFDCDFFGISPRESELTDPQHRLFLETCWAALEDAGYTPANCPNIGVYGAASTATYMRLLLERARFATHDFQQVLIGNDRDYLTTRVSYKLGLTGPSMTVTSACSSSLLAVHLACQALITGECDMALAGGVSVLFPQAGYVAQQGNIMSPSGRCRPFDAAADGAVGGGGCAVVALKRMQDAVDAGDDIYAVIRGSAANNDGSAKPGYHAPSVEGQKRVIRAALHAAGISAAQLGYIETHGTGTYVGDQIEWQALTEVLAEQGTPQGRCAIGTLKANIGHLDVAAGVAGLIKAALVLRHGVIPPAAGFQQLNPLLQPDSPLYMPTTAKPWPVDLPHIAGISSFGIGGTNVHVALERAPLLSQRRDRPAANQIVPLSAASAQALEQRCQQLGAFLRQSEDDFADVAYTLAVGRVALNHRLAVVGNDPNALAGALLGSPDARPAPTVLPVRVPPVVFMFPGQGGQHPAMAAPLYERFAPYRAEIDRCCSLLDVAVASDVRSALLGPAAPDQLDRTALAQPAIFVAEYALARLLMALGVRPAACLGHSLGEITAACLAGVLDLGDALQLVVARGRLMEDCPPGEMVAVDLPEAEVAAMLAGHTWPLDLAAVNAPSSCTVAGSRSAIQSFVSEVGDRARITRLRSSRAFHSAAIEPAVAPLIDCVSRLHLAAPRLPYASNLTGQLITAAQATDPHYFGAHARRTVRFLDGLQTLTAHLPDAIFVEVGPGRTLSGLAELNRIAALPLSPRRGEPPPLYAFLSALGTLWTKGVAVDLQALHSPQARRVHLPTYPFQRRRLWASELAAPAPRSAGQPTVVADLGIPQVEQAADGDMPIDQPHEEVLRRLWNELLGQPDLAPDSDFYELGGDSLTLTRLAGRLTRAFGVEVPLRALHTARTIAEQIDLVEDLVVQQILAADDELVAGPGPTMPEKVGDTTHAAR
jgi:phthiocerol/phenolphthiocerol synthesis type-I polyketide synthase E